MNCEVRSEQSVKMAQSAPLIMRLLASSVSVASRAGKIIKDVMSKGELGIIEKVMHFSLLKIKI